jgi:hypothetical protein
MHQSLLNQFRGAYLGAMLGDGLAQNGANCIKQSCPTPPLPFGAIALRCTQTLILSALGKTVPAPVLAEPRSPLERLESLLALAFPCALFYHDDLIQFQIEIAQQQHQWCPEFTQQCSAAEQQHLDNSVLIFAVILSRILHHQFDPLNPEQAIAPLMTDLELSQRSPSWHTALTALADIVRSHQPLAIALEHLAQQVPQTKPTDLLDLALLWSLYLVFSSAADFPLSLRRVYFLKSPSFGADALSPVPMYRLVMLLTGIMGGAYNGLEGIPLSWRQALLPDAHLLEPSDADPPVSSALLSSNVLERQWQVMSEVEPLQLADQLFAVWSGADLLSDLFNATPSVAIASPFTLLPSLSPSPLRHS